MFCVLCRRLFGETRNPQGGCHAGGPAGRSSSVGWQAEAEHAQSAGRRLRPEAVSGRCTERGIGDKDSMAHNQEIAYPKSGSGDGFRLCNRFARRCETTGQCPGCCCTAS